MQFVKESPHLIRKIPNNQNQIFLTFDDGPDSTFTDSVLDLLKKHHVWASFFVIGQKARQNPELIRRMQSEGHQVFSHSEDHNYYHYFLGKNHLKKWIYSSLADLESNHGIKSLGFRPPAGVITPPLIQACEELEIPLYIWTHRFYDTVQKFSFKKAQKSVARIKAGDIILLHDHQNKHRQKEYLDVLDYYIENLKKKNFKMMALPHHLKGGPFGKSIR